MFQTSQSPEFGLAFLLFLLVVLLSFWVSLDSNLGESDGVQITVQFPVTERIGVHGVLSAGGVRCRSDTGIRGEAVFVSESLHGNYFRQYGTSGNHATTMYSGQSQHLL